MLDALRELRVLRVGVSQLLAEFERLFAAQLELSRLPFATRRIFAFR